MAVNSKKRVLVIGVGVICLGLLVIAGFALLNVNILPERQMKTIALILLLLLTVMIAFPMASGALKKTAADKNNTTEAKGNETKRAIEVSDARLLFLQKIYAKEHLYKSPIERLAQYGECLPAVVVSIAPLLISVYSEKTNSAEVYHFPNSMLEKFIVVEGSHLVAVASYTQKETNKREQNANAFNAVILNFVSEDNTQLSQLSFAFPKRLWKDAITQGENIVKEHPERILSGDPALIK